MNRKLFSLAGVLVAVFSFTVGSADVEARHGRRHRCCQQQCHTGHHHHHVNQGYHNHGGNGQCCQSSGSIGYQQNTNYGYRNDGQQQAGHHAYREGTSDAAVVAIDAGQPAAAVQATAPIPNN